MANLQETIKKFDSACRILACTDKSLHDRLDEAIIEISALTEQDFIPDLRKEFYRATFKIRAYRDSGNCSDLQPDTALSILNMCLRLHRDTME